MLNWSANEGLQHTMLVLWLRVNTGTAGVRRFKYEPNKYGKRSNKYDSNLQF